MAQDKNKFLFDLNNFDAPDVEEIIEEEIEAPPPLPTFTEDELDAARASAHNSGVIEGRNNEKENRDQEIADILQKISENFSSLFAAETYREKQYEEESLRLALEILNQLAPTLQDVLGKENLKATLKDTLLKQSNQSEISIEVHPDCATEIDGYIETIWRDKDNAPKCKILANSDIAMGACKIDWADGGMIRNPEKTAQMMKQKIEKLLKNNNKSEEKQNPQDET